MHIEVLHEYKPGNVWSEEELKELTTIEVDANKFKAKMQEEKEKLRNIKNISEYMEEGMVRDVLYSFPNKLIDEWIKNNPNFKYKGFKFYYDEDRYIVLREMPFFSLYYYIEVVYDLKYEYKCKLVDKIDLKSISTIKIDERKLENKSLIEKIEYAQNVMNEWRKNHPNIEYKAFHFYYAIGNYIDLIQIDKVYEGEFEFKLEGKSEKIKTYTMLANKKVDLKHNQIMITLNCIMDLYADKDISFDDIPDVMIIEGANIDIKVVLELPPYLKQNLDKFLEEGLKSDNFIFYLEKSNNGPFEFLIDNFDIKSIDDTTYFSYETQITIKPDILLPNNKISNYSCSPVTSIYICNSNGEFLFEDYK